MSTQLLLKQNNAFGTIGAAMTVGQTSITLLTGHTMPTANGYFYAIIWDITHYPTPFLDASVEIVLMSYSGTPNVYNITRAQESTSASIHPANSQVAMTITAGTLNNDLSIIGSHPIDESSIQPGYYIYYDGVSNTYKLQAGSNSSTQLPFGVVASRPASPIVGQWYLATDTQSLYTCYSGGTWTLYPPPPIQNSNIQRFISSGTFTAPTGITTVYLTMIGGGGSGSGNYSSANRAGGGSGGQYLINYPYTVVAGNNYTVTIGAGGVYGNNSTGASGGTTTFDTLSVLGGAGGSANTGGTSPALGMTPANNQATGGKPRFPSGNGASSSLGVGVDAGGGGGTPFGNGGSGGLWVGTNGVAPIANTGAGGGGAIQSGGDGTSGASGFVSVAY